MRRIFTPLSFLVCVLLTQYVAEGFTEFHRLRGPHQKAVHPDGSVQYSHDMHHHFESHGTYFKARYNAVHEAKWHIVDLSEEIPDFSNRFRCSAKGEQELYIRNATVELVALLRKQSYQHTVVTAHPKHHCSSKFIFRHLHDVKEEDGRIVLTTTPAVYTDIFRDLTLSITTNHVFMTEPDENEELDQSLPLESRSRAFDQQRWKIFKAIEHAVSSTVHDVVQAATAVAHTVEKVATTAVHVVEAVGEIVAGDYSKTGVWDLPGINFNKDKSASKSFGCNNLVTVSATGAVSFVLTPTIHFDIDIKSWSLQELEVYFEGDAEAAVSAQMAITLQKTISEQKQVADIKLSTISFMIGPVPVVISPSIPINAGFTLNIDGQLAVGADFHATGTVKHGFSYSKATGHQTINEHSYTFDHDFSPKTYSVEVGLTAFVQPMLTVSIDAVLNGAVGAAIYGDILVQSNTQCIFDLSVDVRPIISVQVGIDLKIAGHDIFSKNWGPMTVWTQTYPLFNYCKPNPLAKYLGGGSGAGAPTGSGSGAVRHLELQAASPEVNIHAKAAVLNDGPVLRTTFTQLGPGNFGKVWSGQAVACGAVDTHFSVRFTAGNSEGSSLAIVTVSQTKVPRLRASDSSLAQAMALLLYEAEGYPTAAGFQRYALVNLSDSYIATTNATELAIHAPPTMTLTFSPNDVRLVSMDIALTCGPVSLETPESSNDNTTFNYFKRVREMASATVDTTNSNSAAVSTTADSSTNALAAYAAVVSAFGIASTASAIFMWKRSQSRRSVDRVKQLQNLLNDNGEELAANPESPTDETVNQEATEPLPSESAGLRTE